MYTVIEILFFFSKIIHLPTCINASGCLFPNFRKYLGMGIEKKKLSKIKTSMCPRVYSISVHDTRRQPDETQDPLTRTLWTAKEARADEVRYEHPMGGESFYLHSRSRIVSGSLGERIQPA